MQEKNNKLHNLINVRGFREQAFKFALGHKGGMKGCFTKGCDIYVPLQYTLKGVDISDVLIFDAMFSGEKKADPLMW